MLSNEFFYLTQYIKSLGYSDYSSLSNKVRDILKSKESFSNYIISDEHYFNKREDKVKICFNGEVLVKNIALLEQFPKLFVRGDRDIYQPYKELKKGLSSEDIKNVELKVKRQALSNINKSLFILDDIDSLLNGIKDRSIDLTKDSISELISNVDNKKSNQDYSMFIELMLIQEKVLMKENKSDNVLIFLADQFIQCNLLDKAEKLLLDIISLNDDGIAHMLLSYVYNHYLNKEIPNFNRFSYRVENHPITSEEHFINDSACFFEDKILDFKNKFIKHAIKGLKNTPHILYNTHYHSCALGDDSFPTQIKTSIKRPELFNSLLLMLSDEDVVNHKNDLILIYKSMVYDRHTKEKKGIFTPVYDFDHMNIGKSKNINKKLFKLLKEILEKDDYMNSIRVIFNNFTWTLSFDFFDDKFMSREIISAVGYNEYVKKLQFFIESQTSQKESILISNVLMNKLTKQLSDFSEFYTNKDEYKNSTEPCDFIDEAYFIDSRKFEDDLLENDIEYIKYIKEVIYDENHDWNELLTSLKFTHPYSDYNVDDGCYFYVLMNSLLKTMHCDGDDLKLQELQLLNDNVIGGAHAFSYNNYDAKLILHILINHMLKNTKVNDEFFYFIDVIKSKLNEFERLRDNDYDYDD